MKNKRGQELSTNTIILVILGIIVLVILVLGFTLGWNKVFPFIFSTNNVETIKTSCAAACATNNEYAYCSQERTLKAEDLPAGPDGKVPKEVKNTCNFFANDPNGDGYLKYGIEKCPAISCNK